MQKLNPKENKRVLFITSTFPRGENDFLANWIGKLAAELQKKGIDLEVFAPSYKGIGQTDYRGIPIHRFRYAPSFLEVLTQDEGAVFKLRKRPWLFPLVILYILFGMISIINLTRKRSYNIVHAHWPLPQGLFGVIGKYRSSAKLILTFYGAEFSLLRRVPFGRAILRFIIRRADKIVAISQSTKRKIQDIENVPVEIIPFTSSIVITTSKTTAMKKNKQRKKILFVGRLIERKGAVYLIKAMTYVLQSSKCVLDIVGEGPLYPSLKEKVKKIGLDKNVTLHGKVNENQLKQFYEECDIFVLPAIRDKWEDTEGLGVVLLEAMSFGKPVIASKVGGITDIVKDKVNGLLVPEKDSKKLADAIVVLLKNDKLRKEMGEKGREIVKREFNWESIVDKTLKLYDK